MAILVEYGGFFTTVQDGGRIGYQQFGIPQSGAADRRSLALANLLAGNEEDEAALEAAAVGPRLAFSADNVIAVTGARMPPLLNGAPVPMYRTVSVRAGDSLSFGPCEAGLRVYIAFAGGLDVPPVMGSRSTCVRAGLGGVGGRALRRGDRIGFRAPRAVLPDMAARAVPPDGWGEGIITLRAVPGPQEDRFAGEGIRAFYGTVYTVGRRCDRMGCRLEGEAVRHLGDGNILSDGIAHGAVQIPSDGLPIIMLADRQTTGGYTKIATVASADLPLVAQCRGGERVRFRRVGVREAQDLYLAQRGALQALRSRWSGGARAAREYDVRVNGNPYRVRVEPAD